MNTRYSLNSRLAKSRLPLRLAILLSVIAVVPVLLFVSMRSAGTNDGTAAQGTSAAHDGTDHSLHGQPPTGGHGLGHGDEHANHQAEAPPHPQVQRFASLAEAASQPVGNSARTDTPAAAVQGTHRQINPADVLPDIKNTGVLSGGCLINVGIPGDQCVPVNKKEP